jgi:hypothetical protein
MTIALNCTADYPPAATQVAGAAAVVYCGGGPVQRPEGLLMGGVETMSHPTSTRTRSANLHAAPKAESRDGLA